MPSCKLDSDGHDVGEVISMMGGEDHVSEPTVDTDDGKCYAQYVHKGWVMFRVTLKNPYAVAQKINAVETSTLTSSDMTVSLLRVKFTSTASGSFVVTDAVAEKERANHKHLAGYIADAETLLECIDTMFVFDNDPQLHFAVPHWEGQRKFAVSNAIGALDFVGARESSMDFTKAYVCENSDTVHLPSLKVLEGEGLVRKTFENNVTSGWQISEVCESYIETCTCIRNARKIWTPRLGMEIKDQTV